MKFTDKLKEIANTISVGETISFCPLMDIDILTFNYTERRTGKIIKLYNMKYDVHGNSIKDSSWEGAVKIYLGIWQTSKKKIRERRRLQEGYIYYVIFLSVMGNDGKEYDVPLMEESQITAGGDI